MVGILMVSSIFNVLFAIWKVFIIFLIIIGITWTVYVMIVGDYREPREVVLEGYSNDLVLNN